MLSAIQVKKKIMADSVLLKGRLLPINADAKKGQGCYFEILEAIDDQLTAMLSHHSRVLVVILGFHVYQHSETNQLMSQFIRKIKKRLKHRYKMLRVGHVWVRERHSVEQQHYHAALFLDGNAVRQPFNVISLCEEVWQGWNQPKPHTPKHCYYLISRNDKDAYMAAFRRLSYLAKLRGKGRKPKATNDYSVSRIVCKQQKENRDEQI